MKQSYRGSEQHLLNALNASRLGTLAQQRKRTEREQAYGRDPRICERIGCFNAIPYAKKSTNRFCASSCAAIHNSSKRDCSHSSARKAKIQQSILLRSVSTGQRKLIDGEAVFERSCAFCRRLFVTKQRRTATCSPECRRSLSASKLNIESLREKGRANIQKQMSTGRWKGWSGQSLGKRSYPEAYVESLLLHAGFSGYVFQHQVSRYSLDFAFPETMVVLEVDGKQHFTPQAKKHDAERDSFLQSLGWRVFRLAWYSVKTPAGVAKVNRQFQDFLDQMVPND